MSLDRRRFLELMAALSASSVLSSACSSTPTATQLPASGTATAPPTATTNPSATPLPPTSTLTPTLEPSATPTPSPTPDDGRITTKTIAAAEKLFGIELTDIERLQIVEGLNEHLEWYQSLRDEHMDDTVVPAMVFNPIPPGMAFEKEQKPVRFTDVQVVRPNNIEELAFASVLELGKLLRTQQITSAELTQMYLERLHRYNEQLQFVISFTDELALAQAAQADQEIQAGNYRGPLHGIPYGVKDLFSVKNYPTTWGTEPFKDRIIDRDASVVEKLVQAGAVLVAKLSTGALASGDHWFGGETKNPWNPRKWRAGGSSAGPGSATAAGCVGFSIGTETNGSMVSPCDACGVTGLRPTFGRVSRYGVMTTSWSFDKVTPICRTVEDCAVVLDAIYGPDGHDNTIVDLPFNWDPDMDISQLRIGYHRKFFEEELMEGNVGYRTAVREASLTVLDFFRDRNFNLVPLDFDQVIQVRTGMNPIMETESATAFDEFSRSNLDDLVERDSRWPTYFRQFRFVPAVEYLQASRYRSIVMQRMQQVMQDIDVFIEITWSNVWLTNTTGHPYLVVPCGFIQVDGVAKPTTVSFVGNLFGEAKLLAVGKTFQDATDFHLRHPNL